MSDPLRAARQLLETENAFGWNERRPVPAETASDALLAADSLDALRQNFADCRRCPLSASRTKLVFGSGDPKARLVFVGEAPGYDEDLQGLPFVGKAGQLLTRIIEAMQLTRDDVYIANTLKCRPPENRSPLPSELACCQPILFRQLEIIRPAVICALGKYSAQTLLGTDEPIGRLRGQFRQWRGIPVMPTFHPAYLLRNPEDKKLVWEDMKKVMAQLGISVPVKK